MTTQLALSLLGTVAITVNGEQVTGCVPAKSQALLCYLAVTGRAHSREKLAGLLWGDKSETKARANLRKELFILQNLFDQALIITHQTVAFSLTLHTPPGICGKVSLDTSVPFESRRTSAPSTSHSPPSRANPKPIESRVTIGNTTFETH